jgi:hypothetical protein
MAIHPDVLAEITLDDLTGDLRLIAEQTSIEVALELHRQCSGLKLYIPQSGLDDFKRRFIAQNRKKYNPKQLASMLGVTEMTVYNVLNEERLKAAQEDLFSSGD